MWEIRLYFKCTLPARVRAGRGRTRLSAGWAGEWSDLHPVAGPLDRFSEAFKRFVGFHQ